VALQLIKRFCFDIFFQKKNKKKYFFFMEGLFVFDNPLISTPFLSMFGFTLERTIQESQMKIYKRGDQMKVYSYSTRDLINLDLLRQLWSFLDRSKPVFCISVYMEKPPFQLMPVGCSWNLSPLFIAGKLKVPPPNEAQKQQFVRDKRTAIEIDQEEEEESDEEMQMAVTASLNEAAPSIPLSESTKRNFLLLLDTPIEKGEPECMICATGNLVRKTLDCCKTQHVCDLCLRRWIE
jgi:hypothetical protein